MTRKCQSHITETNEWYHEDEAQEHRQRNTQCMDAVPLYILSKYTYAFHVKVQINICLITGTNLEFLESGFICSKVWGRLCWFYRIFLIFPMKMKQFGHTETKLSHFHRLYINGEWGGGKSEPPEPLWISHC